MCVVSYLQLNLEPKPFSNSTLQVLPRKWRWTWSGGSCYNQGRPGPLAGSGKTADSPVLAAPSRRRSRGILTNFASGAVALRKRPCQLADAVKLSGEPRTRPEEQLEWPRADARAQDVPARSYSLRQPPNPRASCSPDERHSGRMHLEGGRLPDVLSRHAQQ